MTNMEPLDLSGSFAFCILIGVWINDRLIDNAQLLGTKTFRSIDPRYSHA